MFPLKPLEEVAKIIRGITFKPDDVISPEDENAIVCFRTKNVQQSLDESDLIAIPPEFVKREDQHVRNGDILVSSANSWNLVGKCCYVPELNYKATAGGFISILRGTAEKIDSRYLYHWFSSPDVQTLLRSFGRKTTNISNLNIKLTLQAEIPLPPLSAQKRIAGVLDKADALREKRRLALQTLDALLQSVFLEMFGDPVKNPKGWGKVSLADCTERIIDCPHSTPIWQDDGIICLRTSNLLYGEWNWEDTRYISPDDYHSRTSRSSIDTGDIILSREGTVGVAAIVEHNMKVCMGQRLVQVRPDEQKTISEYLLRLLLFELAPERIETFMVGSTSKHINVAQLRKLPIMLPPIELQKQFKSISQHIKKLKNSSLISFNYSNNLFQSLQQRAFKGELFSDQSPTVKSEEEKAWGQTSLF